MSRPLAPHDPAPPPRGWSPFLGALSGRGVGMALLVGVAVAGLLYPIFMLPFPVILGRTVFLAMVLLLVYAAARQWQPARLPEWMPRWMVPVVAVGLGAPVATLGVYLLSVGGNISEFVMSPPRLLGFVWLAGTGLVFGLLVALSASVRERLAQARTEALEFELERSRLEKQAVDAQLALLQAQIEPHFLFNTLANVQALVEAGSPRAADVLKSLIDYLRAAMPRLHDRQATLADEIGLVRAYLELMRMRMPDRLSFAIEVPADLQQRPFPAMALLTLVENAVRHGIDPSEDGGRIDIGASAQTGGGLRLWVADTGVGLDEQMQPGTGLNNLRGRLQAMHGAAASLHLMEQPPHGVRAEIHLPEPDHA